MELYGPTLRKIRKQKGLSMKQLAKETLSVSFLSKFERGESDISLHAMTSLLTRLNVSYDEFIFIHYDYSNPSAESFFHRSNQAYLEHDLTNLERLMEEEENPLHKVLLELYRNVIKNETSEELEQDSAPLSEYLFSVEVWGYYELKLYKSTMLLFPHEMVLNLSHTAFKRGKRYYAFRDYKSMMASIFLNTIVYLMGPVNMGDEMVTTYEKDIRTFFSYIEELELDENETHLRIHIKYMKGIYMIKKGQIEEGIDLVDTMITLLRELNCKHTAADLDRFADLVLKNQKI